MNDETRKPWEVTANRMKDILENTDFSYLDKEMEEYINNCNNRKGLDYKDVNLDSCFISSPFIQYVAEHNPKFNEAIRIYNEKYEDKIISFEDYLDKCVDDYLKHQFDSLVEVGSEPREDRYNIGRVRK